MKNNNSKHFYSILLLLLITFIVMYFCLKDDFKTTLNLILNVNYWFLLALLLIISYWFFRTLSIYSITRKYKSDYKFSSAFRLVVTTQFFHAVTPFATGGQPYEIYSLKKQNIDFSDVTNISIQNFIVYQIALVLLGIIAMITNYFCNLFPNVGILKNLIVLGFVINTLVIILLFLLTFSKKLHKFIFKMVIKLLYKIKIIKDIDSLVRKMEEGLNNFNKGALRLLKEKKHFLQMIIVNLVGLIILYVSPVVILYSLGDYISFSPIEAIISSAYVMLIGSFVPIPGGTGGLEYGFIRFYSNFTSGSKLNALMILWRFITYYFGMIVGFVVLNIKGRKRKL